MRPIEPGKSPKGAGAETPPNVQGHFRDKLQTLSELAQILDEERAVGKTIVQCHGVFDLLHPGHIRHFSEAKRQGDILVVTLTRDEFVNKGPGRPAFNSQLRAESLSAIGDIDYVAINDTPTAVEAIRALKPDVYVKGQDYEDRKKDITQGINSEEATVHEVGGRIHFTHDITFSSTEILNKNFAVYPEEARSYLKSFGKQYNADQIIHKLEDLKNLKVLVLGDTIVDEYHYCQPLGKSPKETIVATRYLNQEGFPGGILAIVNHIAEFVEAVDLVTVLGSQDSKEEFVDSQLSSKVKTHYFYRDDAPTNVKRRYVEPAFLTKMFQIAFLNDTPLPNEVEKEVIGYLEKTLSNYDAVVLADYGHGFITPAIQKLLSEKSPFLAVNVQTNSANQGYNLITKYEKADYISIDEPELRLAMREKYTPINELVSRFSKEYEDCVVTITRGHNGSITITPETYPGSRSFKALSVSSKVVDRVGAGDAYFAVTSLLAANKNEAEVIGFVGNAVGSLAVGIVCNRSSIQPVSVYKSIKALLAH